MKTLILIVFAALAGTFQLTCTAQNYFVVGKDTTFCKSLIYFSNAQGALNSIKYIDPDGKTVEFKGKNNVPDVTTFCKEGICWDKIPLKAEKPGGYTRYTMRIVDGKLKVYLAQQGYRESGSMYSTASTQHGVNTVGASSGPTGLYRFFIKMPDGNYYKINSKKNIKEIIKPYLLKCDEFADEYKGDFSSLEEPFMEMITLYNSLCN